MTAKTIPLVIVGVAAASLLAAGLGWRAAPAPVITAAKPGPAPHPKPAPAPPPETPFVVKRILRIDGPMRQGSHYWDEAGVPAGPVVITVDLAAETVSIFRAGYEIGTAVIIFGADEKPTPTGVFPITQKDAHHISNLYDAPMPYMLRLTNDGISIHGSEVGDGYVTHGCIGVPTAFAKQLFEAVKLGDRVIVTRGKRLDLGEPIIANRNS